MAVDKSALDRLLDKIVEDENEEISIKSLTTGGAHYTSSLFSITIKKKREDLKLFAKVVNISQGLRETASSRHLFLIEEYVYTNLVETYERLQEKHGVAPEYRYLFPKFYGADDTDGEETLILEDLVHKGYGLYSRFKSIDWDHAAAAVESLARFHALSLAFAKEEPKNFARILEKVNFDRLKKRDEFSIKATIMKSMAAGVEVAREEHKQKISKFFLCEPKMEDLILLKLPLSTPVICHGDCKISNMLFQKQVSYFD